MKHAIKHLRKTGRPLSFNRDEVLREAMLTFWRHGYETTSIADLTKAMSITAPSLYSAFGDKKRLFLEAMHLYAGAPADLYRALQEAPTARDAVHRLLSASAEGFTGPTTPPGCLLASATASGSIEAADVQQAVTDVRRQIVAMLTERIKSDVDARILPADTDTSSLAQLVVAVIQGMSVLARDGTGQEALKAIGRMAVAAWPRETTKSHS